MFSRTVTIFGLLFGAFMMLIGAFLMYEGSSEGTHVVGIGLTLFAMAGVTGRAE